MENKPIKQGFKWWCRCCSKTGYLYQFDFYLGKKEKIELRLGDAVVLNLSEKLETHIAHFSLITFLILCY